MKIEMSTELEDEVRSKCQAVYEEWPPELGDPSQGDVAQCGLDAVTEHHEELSRLCREHGYDAVAALVMKSMMSF